MELARRCFHRRECSCNEIAFKTVVIAYTDSEGNPQFRKMDKVWELLPDQEAFERYIASAVQEAIDGAAS